MPAPGGADNVIQIGINGIPAQLGNGFFVGCDQHRRVARPAAGIFSEYIFAGDIGATPNTSPSMYHQDSNITYIASGMGSIEMDNYIIVNISGTGHVSFELIAMGDDAGKLGKLEDHYISGSP